MNTPLLRRLPAALTIAALTLAAVSACVSTTASSVSTTSAADAPITIENCGSEVTLKAPAKRIVLVNNDSLPNLEALDAVDRVVALTSAVQPGLYEDSTYTTLASLDLLSTEKNATGGSIVSQESILGAQPDLVIAPENAVDRAALAAAGIAVYTPSAYCANPGPELSKPATFGRVWSEVRTLGTLLGESDKAEQVVEQGSANLGSNAPDAGTAAALYVSSGGSVLSPYGGPSMVTPVFTAAGLTNVYADSTERVFDANIEDIISRDPATIVLLYSSGEPKDVIDSFMSAPGVSALSAVQKGRVVALQFPYTDPPSMLSIAGPQHLRELLSTLP
ncbi:ABC transporter substrate-binding protein [Agreia sp. VKM Ac-1783]|uniref:ABC transporter substrate-binding protein n=1 Tax=Agreia sp. VKM Ac-1783 TaxID=1938889 RepID=UPI000A2AA493|nr:ABC transporter substrate-binding protein [Agreia sp. VKM Ac-1783]SMQ74852.1 iron complex transport system substrate-binding protein [Agreia sp. VKM Ac-1783]